MRKTLILLLVAALPLVLHLHFIEFPFEVLRKFPVTPLQPDIFAWWKNALLYSVSGLLCVWGWRKPMPLFRQCILAYLGGTVYSSVSSDYPEIVWFGMPNYLEGTVAIASYCVLFLSSADVAMDPKKLEKPSIFCTLAMFGACALQYINPEWFKWASHFIVFGNRPDYQMGMETWPLFGTLMNSNLLGTFAALMYAFFLARGKWVMTAIAVVMAVGSQSRGAWFAMVIATIYLGFKYRTWRLAIPAAFFVIGVTIVYLHPTHGGMKWSVASSGRTYVWKHSFETMSPHHLLFGNGPGAYAMEFNQDDAKGKIEQGWTPQTIVDRPHNFYLQVLHASGLLSLVALLVLFAGFFVESKEVALNAAVLSYLVNVFFTDSCTAVAPLFWIFLGTGVGRLKSLNKEKS
jgi:hypothetical protein